jgi:hypothetical protein
MDAVSILFLLLILVGIGIGVYYAMKKVPSAGTQQGTSQERLETCPTVTILSPGDIGRLPSKRLLEFSLHRQAFLFKPGIYTLTQAIEVTYYTDILGLGKDKGDVQFTGSSGDSKHPSLITVNVNGDGSPGNPGSALSNFWRSMQNVTVKGGIDWFVSQASPLRMVTATDNIVLNLGNFCYASGGYASNITTPHLINSGNQQWFARNSNIDQWDEPTWFNVGLNCNGPLQEPHPSLVRAHRLLFQGSRQGPRLHRASATSWSN